ncbi:hypothetical protein [Neptuniibacter sp. QD37_11]|uniref:hypothetical protein n=1 Tax=Neptuniibacter sp. QD37_11 TaxID=3398209 RepID=UPI0039F5A33D
MQQARNFEELCNLIVLEIPLTEPCLSEEHLILIKDTYIELDSKATDEQIDNLVSATARAVKEHMPNRPILPVTITGGDGQLILFYDQDAFNEENGTVQVATIGGTGSKSMSASMLALLEGDVKKSEICKLVEAAEYDPKKFLFNDFVRASAGGGD